MAAPRSPKGFSLIELMIALSIGTIVTGAATSIYLMNIRSTSNTIKSTKLVQQSNTMMSIITNDIRRAGYRLTNTTSNPTANIFGTVDDTALEVFSDYTDANDIPLGGANVSGNCIIFAYDSDNDGELDDGEVTGYRLRNNTIEVRSRKPGSAGVTPRNTCDDNINDDWVTLNNNALIQITALSFNHEESSCLNNREPDNIDNDGDGTIDEADEADCYATIPMEGSGDITVETRQIEITLAARLTSDNSSTYSVQQDVRIRNDLVRER